MSLIEYEWNGRKVTALQVGEYVVLQCCNKNPVDPSHAVIHMPSSGVFMCGFSADLAHIVADALSLYGDRSSGKSHFTEETKRIAAWASYQLHLKEWVPYAAWHEMVFGKRPKPNRAGSAELARVVASQRPVL